ncbi:hypothetical protein [Pelomonas sp. KK5]|uniref:hypothetical protein n=1 Tax=Pelomonas sp. KK5 TaxID=1855730 RepID=UPI0018E94ED9|nr:hypothetical protein [Pelomonas sp. KK5]
MNSITDINGPPVFKQTIFSQLITTTPMDALLPETLLQVTEEVRRTDPQLIRLF